MKNTKGGFIFLLALSIFICFPLMAMAQGCQKGKGSGQGCGFEKKLFCKLHLVLVHQEALGLTAEQVSKIKKLKMSTKKDSIKNEADIDLITVDIKAKLCEENICQKSVGKLIDKKYDLKKEKAKAFVSAFAEMNNLLSDEQQKQLGKMVCKASKCSGSNTQHPKVTPKCGRKQ